jgi:hypothetical protein
MMDELHRATTIALNTPVGSPPYNLACTICHHRTVPPNAMGPNGMLHWQSVIAESQLQRELAGLLALQHASFGG